MHSVAGENLTTPLPGCLTVQLAPVKEYLAPPFPQRGRGDTLLSPTPILLTHVLRTTTWPDAGTAATSNRLRETQGPAIRRIAIGMDPRMYFKFPVNYK